MLRLNGVGKTYISQTGTETHAICDVSLSLPDSGLVCLSGKSGSGKSTLLNLLGGLDSPTDGDILVNGISMASFSNEETHAYLNGYVGFIFQEFNLLSDLNVFENISLALRLDTNGDSNKVNEALSRVGLNDDYLYRRVNELSGGEKQRVAIARCIVKNSKLILADEPTGNLDSATAENIWQLLKMLSADRLVLVVTHDSESAEKYADRVITLADGNVISDTCESVQQATSNEEQRFIAKKLPLKFVFKLGLNNMRHRTAKTAGTILLLIFCTLALIVSQMLLCYSPLVTVGKYADEYDVPFVLTVQQSAGRNDNGKTFVDSVFKSETEKWLSDRTPFIINCTVSSSEQLRMLGLNFTGEVSEPVGNGFYVTRDYLKESIQNGAYMMLDGQPVRISGGLSVDSLVGKPVYLSQVLPEETEFPILYGIIDSSCVPDAVNMYLPPIFVSEHFVDCSWAQLPGYSDIYNDCGVRDVEVQFGDVRYSGRFCLDSRVNNNMAMKGQSLSDYVCKDDEIVLSYEMLAALYDVAPKDEFFRTNGVIEHIVACPEQVGQKLHFVIGDAETGQTFVDLGELTLAGVTFNKSSAENFSEINRYCILSPSNYEKVVNTLKCGAQLLVGMGNVSDRVGLLSSLDKRDVKLLMGGAVQKVNGDPVDCFQVAKNMENYLNALSIVVGVIALILIAVLILTVSNLIGCGITDRQKDIGVLSALGVPNKNIQAIFFVEIIVIAALSFLFAFGIAFGFASVCNAVYSNDYLQTIRFFGVDAVTFLTVAASSFALPSIAALIPLRRISKMSPIDAIRHI